MFLPARAKHGERNVNKEYIQKLYYYNQWANGRILDTAAKLTPEQFLATGNYPYGSLRGILVHTFFAEWIWRKRWEGESPKTGFKPEEFPTCDLLRDRWRADEEELMKFVARVTDERLNSPFRYTSTEGAGHENILWEAMAHLVNHGTQHRSESAFLLTELGHSPGDLDMILYFRRKP